MVYKESNLNKVKKHIEKLPILNENKKHILQFIDQLAAEGISKTRQQKYMYILGSIAKLIDKNFMELTKNDIVALCSEINNSDLAEWTKHDRLVAIKRFMKFIHEKKGESFDKGEYPINVKWISTTVRNNRKKLPTDLLSPDDVKELSNHTNNLRDRALIWVLFESGARIAELQNIKVKDVVFDKYGALLDLYGKTGSRRIRLISSPPSISNWLLDHPKKSNQKFRDSYLFCSLWGKNRGEFLSYPQINLLLKDTAKKAGITKPVRPHWFRHSRATILARQLPEAVMCEFFGWVPGSKEVGTYTHLSAKNIDSAILKIHGIKTDSEEKINIAPIKCPRCNQLNDPGAKFCSSCSLALDEKTIMEYDKRKEQSAKLGFDFESMVSNDQELLMKMKNLLAEHWAKLMQEKSKSE